MLVTNVPQTFRLVCKGGRKGDVLVGQVSFKHVHLFNSLPSNEKFTSLGLNACPLTQPPDWHEGHLGVRFWAGKSTIMETGLTRLGSE